MDAKNTSTTASTTVQASPQAPFTTIIQLDGGSSVPSQFRTPGTFTITRLQSPTGLPARITKLSPVPRCSCRSPLSLCHPRCIRCGHQTNSLPHPSFVHFAPMSSIFDSQPRCWAGSAFDYVHYSVPREGLDDIAEDLGFGRVSEYRLAVLEDDLVVARITKSILPFLGRNDRLLRAGSRSIQPHPRSTSRPVRCTPENSTSFQGRACAMAKASSLGTSSSRTCMAGSGFLT